MKKNAFAILVKDVLLAAIAWGIGAMLMSGMDMANAWQMGILFAGVPFGWKLASNIITAVSFKGIGIKLLISLFLGWFAVFFILAVDVIRCIGQLIGKGVAKKRQRRVMEEC